MSYRDDLEASQARAEALSHEVEKLERENAELREHREAPKTPKAPRTRARWWLPVTFVGGLLAVIAGIVFAVTSCLKSHVEGAISASGRALGTWTVHPTWCRSGQNSEFRGVQFFEDGGNEHGVGFHQPVGEPAFISVNMQSSNKSYRFTDRACSVLDGTIQKQSSSVNNVTNLRGHVKFDCTDGGEHVSGDLTFENCH